MVYSILAMWQRGVRHVGTLYILRSVRRLLVSRASFWAFYMKECSLKWPIPVDRW